MLTREELSPSDGLWDFVAGVEEEALGRLRLEASTVLAVVQRGWHPLAVEACANEAEARAVLAPAKVDAGGLAYLDGRALIVIAHEEEDEVACRFARPIKVSRLRRRWQLDPAASGHFDAAEKLFLSGPRGPASRIDRGRAPEGTPIPGLRIGRELLERARDRLVEGILPDYLLPMHRLELLARTHRWLDDPDSARASTHEATDDLKTHVTLDWPGVWNWKALGGALLLAAGEGQDAVVWLEVALRDLKADPEARPHEVAEVLYLLGEWDQVAAIAPDDSYAGVLARARLGHSVDLASMKSALRDELWRLGAGPDRAGGYLPWTAWEWLEECFVLEADAGGLPRAPSHLEMLEACCLLDHQQADPGTGPPIGARRRVEVDVRDGSTVEATLKVAADGVVHAVLDPRSETHFRFVVYPGDTGFTWQSMTGPEWQRGFTTGHSWDAYARFEGAIEDAIGRFETWDPRPNEDAPYAARALRALMEAPNVGSEGEDGASR